MSFGLLLDRVPLVDLGGVKSLGGPRRPLDDRLRDLRALAEAEVEAAHVLRRVAVAALDGLHLLVVAVLVGPVEADEGADGAAVALRALQVELHPGAARLDGVAVVDE